MATTTKTPTLAATIASATRTAIKTSRAAGQLTLPDAAKVSIRSANFSQGCEVGVRVDVDQAWAWTTADGPYGERLVLTPAGKKAAKKLVALLAEYAAGRCWGDVTLAGISVDGGTIHPSHWRPGQD